MTIAEAAPAPLAQRHRPVYRGPFRTAVVSLFSFESLGARAVYAFMKDAGHDVDLVFLKEHALNVFDMPSEAELGLFVGLLREREVRAVGLAVRSPYLKFARDLTRRLRGELGVPVIWGGTAATVTPDVCIGSGADYAVCGEGEEAFAELINALASGQDPTGIANIWYAGPEGPKGNAPRPLIADLDALPIPDLEDAHKFVVEHGELRQGEPWRHSKRYELMASRGCPYKCTYCSNSVFHEMYRENPTPFVRRRSVAHVMRELDYARQKLPNLGCFFFGDEVFAEDQEWLESIAVPYKERIGLPFECVTDPRRLSEGKIRALKDAGAREVNIGIQAGSREIRYDLFRRAVDDEDILNAARLVHQYGLEGRYDLITDNPFESEEDKRASLEMLLKLPHPWILNLYSLNYFPRTLLTEYALEKGVITEADVAGSSEKCLEQWTASMHYPRSPRDLCWNALYTLASKPFIPKGLIRWMSRRDWLKRHPRPVVLLARVSSLVRLAIDGTRLLLQGRIDIRHAIRFARSIRSINR